MAIAATLALILSSGVMWIIDTDHSDIVLMPPAPEQCAEYVVHYYGMDKVDTHILVTDLKTLKVVMGTVLPSDLYLQWRDEKWQKPVKDCGDPIS